MDPTSIAGEETKLKLEVALRALKNRNFAEAAQHFAHLSRTDHTEAMGYLGILYLRGLGVDYDPVQAFHWTERAAQKGLATACLTLAHLSYLGLGTSTDKGKAKTLLLAAARTGHPAALRTLGLVYLGLGRNWRAYARLCFEAASTQRDVFANHALAVMLLGEELPEQAIPLLAWAGTQGLLPSLLRLKGLQNRLGLAAVRELAILPIQSPNRAHQSAIQPFNWEVPSFDDATIRNPRIRLRTYSGLLDPIECDYLIALAAPYLRPAETREPGTGRIVQNPIRTSSAMSMPPNLEDLVLFGLEERIAGCAGYTLDRSEPLAVLRYRPGEEYRPHFDAFDVQAMHQQPEFMRLGQRTETALVNLNDEFTGGETAFPSLGSTIVPIEGQGIVFSNLDPAGDREPLALHAGLPVQSGEKWLATLWFRERTGGRQPAR
ncbi:MAG: 2OG-Fe(II) oxygenase [Gammaproteobacteria bacterium]